MKKQINEISEVTRRNIFDEIIEREVLWHGRLSPLQFLERLYDLENLQSCDTRFSNAAEDIWQHCVNNPHDWDDYWVFYDERFNLIQTSDENFIRFLCEMIHPVVRPDEREVDELLSAFNSHLEADGWEIAAITQISGRPVFAGRRKIFGSAIALSSSKPVLEISDYISQQITRMESSINKDTELAIGTAKDFVETICKTILENFGETAKANLHELVQQVLNKFSLVPDNIPKKAKGEEIIKKMHGNLVNLSLELAELRNIYGSGHGKPATVKLLEPRHARLAVNAAAAVATFLFETYQKQLPPTPKSPEQPKQPPSPSSLTPF